MSAMVAQIVRTLQFAAVRALVMSFDLERIMRTAVAAAMGRYFSFGDGHGGTCSSINSRWLVAALGDGPATHKGASDRKIQPVTVKKRAITIFVPLASG
jgi:hypothetical protein